MKSSSKKTKLLGLIALSIFWIIWFVGLTNWMSIWGINLLSSNSGHMIRLYSLFLWSGGNSDNVFMSVNTGENFLTIMGWLVVWNSNNVEGGQFSAIGWWQKNTISGSYLWIVGWTWNNVSGINSLVGWWEENRVSHNNYGVVVWWWYKNQVWASSSYSVIAWWRNNIVNGVNAVVLWGSGNRADWKNALALWYWSDWATGSFSWRATAKENSARIDVDSGVLIWATPIDGVRLVVGWAISLSGLENTDWWTWWEIRVVSWCIYAHDGDVWKVMWKSSESSCNHNLQTCQFWEVLLQQWAEVSAYTGYWASSCSKVTVTCSGWNLVDSINGNTGTYYPYCYQLWTYEPWS